MRDPPTRTSPSQPSPRIPPPLPGEFPTELQKMIRAENYLATDPYLSRLRDLAVVKNDQCNLELEGGKRMKMYKEWVNCGGNCWIMRNFTCEYVRDPLLVQSQS